jgi:integrase
MQNSLGISKTQPGSADVLPYPEENINGRNQRNRTDDSPGGGSFPEDLSVDNAQASSVPIGDNDSDRPRSPSDIEGTSPVHRQPRATGKSQPVKKVKTRPGVLQLKDGRFMTRLELAPDATGKRRRKNFTSSTQQGAIDKKQAYQANVSRNISPEGLKVKFRDYSTWWLKNVAPHTCNPNTINNYETTLRLHITPVLGNMRLQDIRGRHVDDVVYSIQGKGLSLSARKAARRVISTIFSDARRRDLVDDNPVTRSLPPRTAPGEFPKRKATLTPDQTAHVLQYLQGHQYGLLFKTYIYTGMRRGEVAGLTWGDLSHNSGEPLVTVTKQLKEVTRKNSDGIGITTLEETPPKTFHGNRAVPIPLHLYQELERLKNHVGVTNENERIFHDSLGGQLWPSNITKQWSKIRTELGLKSVRLHDLRHSFARTALQGGAPIETVSDTLGHHSITITKDIYASSIPGAARKATDAFSSVIDESLLIREMESSYQLE